MASLLWQIPVDKQLVAAEQSAMNVQFVSADYRFSVFIFVEQALSWGK